MLNFYLEIVLKKWPEAFRQFVTRWRFWAWAVPIGVAYFVADTNRQRLEALQNYLSIWLLFWLLLAAAVYFLLRVVYEEVDEPPRALDELKDKLSVAESTDQLKTVKLVEQLRQLLARGLSLRKEIVRTYLPDKHKARKAQWQEDILSIIRKDAPNYENEMLLAPEGRIQISKPTERDFAVRDMDEWLQKLNTVIKTIDAD